MNPHKVVQILLHPRASSLMETIYAAHGLHAAEGWGLVIIYAGLLLISVAHLIWAHMEMAS